MIQRAAILYSRLSGYVAACLRAVKEQYGTQLLVIRSSPSTEAPFDPHYFDWIDALYDRSRLARKDIERLVLEFDPQVTYVSGWNDAAYLRTARRLRAKGSLVVGGMDAQWKGSLRQHAARALSRPYLHSAFDIMWGAGERQRQFARRLGYVGDRCWTGVYSCDWAQFARIHDQEPPHRPHAFLFVGRYSHVKGVRVLLDAYRDYRSRTDSPWPLLCSGAGRFGSELIRHEGVQNLGFTQPDQLPDLMSKASVLILPSIHEPWGVVVHEAAAAGMPVICTDACGAGVHLVQDRYSGFVVASGDTVQLREALIRMSHATDERRTLMGRRSHELSRQYTPERWAETLVVGATERMG